MSAPPVSAQALQSFSVEAFKKVGVPDTDAQIITGVLIETDLRGVDTHGMMLLPLYIQRLRQKHINAQPNIKVIRESASHALVDGDSGMGHLVGVRAMDICIAKARENGVAVVGARQSNHFGMAAYYSMMALKEGFIGFAATNSPPLIAPTGGITPTFGNNPFSVAIPAGQEPPVVLDIALSVVALAKVYRALQLGQEIRPEWGLDKQGRPTDDPKVAYESGLQPAIGGHKGYGLAVVIDVLAAVLTGARSAREVPDFRPAFGVGHFFAVIDPRLFMPYEEFQARMGNMIRQAKGSALAEGVERIYLPGEPEYGEREKRLREGIPLTDVTRKRLDDVARELGIELSLG